MSDSFATHRDAVVRLNHKRQRRAEPVQVTRIDPLAVAYAASVARCQCRIRISKDRTGLVILNNCPKGLHP